MPHQKLFLLSLLGSLLLCGACVSQRPASYHGPRGFWQTNRFDRHGKAQGRWRTYYDQADKQPFTAGRYHHGRPIRTFYYYTPTGQLDHSERYGREGFCEVTYWYPDGQVARRGHAQWVTGAKGARFYWFGPWTSYAKDGQSTAIETYTDGSLTRVETYENGKLLKVETYERGRLTGSTSTL